ncbi:hypothetical protein Rsub_10617 [Raphidocelis subcapitata]|uniref:Uncharacterized protein n=1 Tax=Raphidocelis subcapitata TaxID=307507 RepID=A0A2V0PDM0_9CHLO|nr:hypothetical protein Rsub_10617 [Raphidocelis subcapitata]|eukprot:GBF97944.1 hypothetical protein Rsub_10617 [Raphidocelis subcapitata]
MEALPAGVSLARLAPALLQRVEGTALLAHLRATAACLGSSNSSSDGGGGLGPGGRRRFAAAAAPPPPPPGAADDALGAGASAALAARRASHTRASSSSPARVSASPPRRVHSAAQAQRAAVREQLAWPASDGLDATQQQQQHHHHRHHDLEWPAVADAWAKQQRQRQQEAAQHEREQRALRRQLQQQLSLRAAVGRAPAPAVQALLAVAQELSLDAEALGAMAEAAARNARQLTLLNAPWGDAAAARRLVAALREAAGLRDDQIARALTRCAALLRGTQAGGGADAALEVLGALRAGAWAPQPAEGGGGARDALAALLVKSPHVLRVPLAALRANCAYLTDTLRLPAGDARAAVAAHPKLLTARPGAVATNMGFLVGLGASGADLRRMMVACPSWATMPLRDLTIKWTFFRQEMKGTLEDLVLTPELLRLSLLDTLGPRAGLARRRRIKLLMPSYSTGHPILQQRGEWAAHRMAPVEFWMTAPPAQLAKYMGVDPEELSYYQEAWKMTTGDKWRRLVLSPTAAGGGGGGGGAEGAPQLVRTPSLRCDEAHGFGAM